MPIDIGENNTLTLESKTEQEVQVLCGTVGTLTLGQSVGQSVGSSVPTRPSPLYQAEMNRSESISDLGGTASSSHDIYVVKRNGRREPVHYDKITERIKKLCWGNLHPAVRPHEIAQKVIQGVYDGVPTSELDELAAEDCAMREGDHPDFGVLASRIAVSNLHKQTDKSFLRVMECLSQYQHPKAKAPTPLVDPNVVAWLKQPETFDEEKVSTWSIGDKLNSYIQHSRDYKFKYFGFQSLCKKYLHKLDNRPCERPQHMYMRVAVWFWWKWEQETKGSRQEAIRRILETYDLLSLLYISHATPTLYNACAPNAQGCSCFLSGIRGDSIAGIYKAAGDFAQISKHAGGLGFECHDIRAEGSFIAGTGGTSNGIVPMLRVFNNTARYVDQGGGKRKGAFAVYLEPWHPDIFGFLDLRKTTGAEENRARDLFYGLWIPDEFMRRVEQDKDWSLFCPHEAPGLADVWGEKFEQLYTHYESIKGLTRKVVPARELWEAIKAAQVETGMPYMLYKDACNAKSNQQHLGTIRCSNLCTEIVEFTSPEETAVCVLGAVNVNAMVVPVDPEDPNGQKTFDFEKLHYVTGILTQNLNRLVDITYYPTPEAATSNVRHRPLAMGVMGQADAFLQLRYPYDSQEAAHLNRDLFETMYFAACSKSCEMAQQNGHPYSSFRGSPLSQGKFQFDLWGVQPSARWNWDGLRAKVIQHGTTNSLFLGPMPTATTSQIVGVNECFEPYTSNLFRRGTLVGEFIVVNHWMQRELLARNLWTPSMRDAIIANDGSVQDIPDFPVELKALYKTAFEIKGSIIIQMAADRGAFICQSHSLNNYCPDVTKLDAWHFAAWKKGLKTGMYYLRLKGLTKAAQMTLERPIDKPTEKPTDKLTEKLVDGPTDRSTNEKQEVQVGKVCTLQDKLNGCESCSV